MSESDTGRQADPFHRRGARFRSRRRAASLLFEAEIRNLDAAELARERQELGAANEEVGEVSPFALAIVEGVSAHRERIDSAISDHLDGWVLERIPSVDRAILRVGAWELLFSEEDTPDSTVIDQAVLLTADIAAEKSMAYVNAVLDQIAGLAGHIKAAEAAVSVLGDLDTVATTEGEGSAEDAGSAVGEGDNVIPETSADAEPDVAAEDEPGSAGGQASAN